MPPGRLEVGAVRGRGDAGGGSVGQGGHHVLGVLALCGCGWSDGSGVVGAFKLLEGSLLRFLGEGQAWVHGLWRMPVGFGG